MRWMSYNVRLSQIKFLTNAMYPQHIIIIIGNVIILRVNAIITIKYVPNNLI